MTAGTDSGHGRWPVSKRQMGIGFMMPVADGASFGTTPRYSDIRAMAQTAEANGYDSLWIPDHLILKLPPETGSIRGTWDPWTLLSGLAEATSTITLGVLVTCLGWRNPALVAKMSEGIEEISGGRFVLGVGAGWHEPEYEMFGFPWDHRVTRFEESLQIIAGLLRTGTADLDGRFFSAHEAVNAPRGPRADSGGPPILVGTSGPRMLGLTARYADAWNTNWLSTPEAAAQPLERFWRACEEEKRDPETIVKTVGSNVAIAGATGTRAAPIIGTDEEIVAQIQAFRDLGFQHWIAGLDPCTPESLARFKDVLDLLDKHNQE